MKRLRCSLTWTDFATWRFHRMSYHWENALGFNSSWAHNSNLETIDFALDIYCIDPLRLQICKIWSWCDISAKFVPDRIFFKWGRDHFVYAPSRWETTSHWLGARTGQSLVRPTPTLQELGYELISSLWNVLNSSPPGQNGRHFADDILGVF